MQALAKGFEFKLVGRVGNRQLAGDDSEICIVMQLLGWKGYYSEKLVLAHNFDPNRVNTADLSKMYQGFGVAFPALMTYWAVANSYPTPSGLEARIKLALYRSNSRLRIYIWFRSTLARFPLRAHSAARSAHRVFWTAARSSALADQSLLHQVVVGANILLTLRRVITESNRV
jgi:hypothetical protein